MDCSFSSMCPWTLSLFCPVTCQLTPKSGDLPSSAWNGKHGKYNARPFKWILWCCNWADSTSTTFFRLFLLASQHTIWHISQCMLSVSHELLTGTEKWLCTEWYWARIIAHHLHHHFSGSQQNEEEEEEGLLLNDACILQFYENICQPAKSIKLKLSIVQVLYKCWYDLSV